MSAEKVAAAHLRRQKALARRAALEVAKLWARVDRRAIGSSWLATIPAVRTVLESAQAIAAASAGQYLDDLLDVYDLPGAPAGRIQPGRFAGVASDGRPLETLLYQPVIGALTAIGQGATVPKAMAVGRFTTDLIVRTQVADAGRVADGVALTARPQLTGWVRMLTLPSCARCVLLAGRRYSWSAGFQRHPRCDCRHIPAPEDVADDLRTDPKAYFRSLPEKEQDRLFTESGAQAIRDGADMARVVNARRGMEVAAGRKVTTEARTWRLRLMPEQIYLEARGNRDEAIRLLRLHGYLI